MQEISNQQQYELLGRSLKLITEASDLCPSDMGVYAHLLSASFGAEPVLTNPRHMAMTAFNDGAQTNQVARCMKRLVKNGYITVVKGKKLHQLWTVTVTAANHA